MKLWSTVGSMRRVPRHVPRPVAGPLAEPGRPGRRPGAPVGQPGPASAESGRAAGRPEPGLRLASNARWAERPRTGPPAAVSPRARRTRQASSGPESRWSATEAARRRPPSGRSRAAAAATGAGARRGVMCVRCATGRGQVAERVHPVVKRPLERPITSSGEGAGVGSDERVGSRGQHGTARSGLRPPRRARGRRGDDAVRRRRPIRCRTGRGATTRGVARAPRTGTSGCHLARARAVEHRVAPRGDAAAARPDRVGRRGAGRLRSGLAGLPPLPDAHDLLPTLRTDARDDHAGRRGAAERGPHRGHAVEHRALDPRLGDRGPGAVRLLDADRPLPALVGQDRVRQPGRPRGARVRGPADRGRPRAGHAQPAAADHASPRGE